MENYIRNNSSVFSEMIYAMIDAASESKWRDDEHKRNFKYVTTADYIRFLYDLGFLPIDRFNKLYKQYEFMIKLTVLCDRYKSIGSECYEGKSDKLLNLLVEHMMEWINNDLDLEIKKQEKIHYTKLCFNKEESPSQQLAGRIAQLKEQSFKNR